VTRADDSATYLHAAQRTAEAAPGNQVGKGRFDETETFTSLYWIARVLVYTRASRPVIVAIGDSITRGDGTTDDRDQRYPDHLQRRLDELGIPGAVVLNAGLGGNRLLRACVGRSMIDRFARDVLSVSETTHVIVNGGLNDIGHPHLLGESRPSANEILEGLFALARLAQERGIQAILSTISPFGGCQLEHFAVPEANECRLAVNQALLLQEEWPVADFAGAVADVDDPSRLAQTFDSGDGLHPGDEGARALARSIELSLLTN
jgi:lysophospholipase L1-like esterase